MLLVAAETILVAVATFFVLLGVISLLRPSYARRFLLGFATSAPKHYAELATRLVAGIATLIVAPHSTHLVALSAFGWLLILTTAVMAIVPWRVHRRFAEAAVPRALYFLPLIGIASLVLGGLLLWSVFTASAA